MEKRDENHRKCDNKNEIYELRLVIYLCANLLLQTKGGCDTLCHFWSEGEKKFYFCKISFSSAVAQ